MGPPPRAQAILLLTVGFGRADPPGLKPLAIGEWNELSRWLGAGGVTPESLLGDEADALLSRWAEREAPSARSRAVTRERLAALLGRGMALGILLERWSRGGLWSVTRSEADHPRRLVERLRHRAPPVLFGCGDRALLNAGGVAVVGSRSASEDDRDFARTLGRRAAEQGLPIVSGDARGVDRAAMEGALEAEGRVIGVLPGNLLRSASSKRHRRWLMKGQLTLVSSFPPETRWRGWQAMDRNKHIYCLADAGVVVTSARGRSGTWAGATETLKKGWVPVWVRPSESPGNVGLVERGARWLPDEGLDRLAALFGPDQEAVVIRGAERRTEVAGDAPSEPATPPERALFAAFLRRLGHLTAGAALEPEQIASRLELQQKQTKDWIRTGVESGNIERLLRPPRYRASGQPTEAPDGTPYDDFLGEVTRLANAPPLQDREVATLLGLRLGQAQLWLRQGVAAGRIRKVGPGYTIAQPRPKPLLPPAGG